MGKRVEDVIMETADNGYKVCCYMYEKKSGGSDMDPMVGSRKEYVFSSDDFDSAVKKFKKLSYMQRGEDYDGEEY